jgi:hypothetical protein
MSLCYEQLLKKVSGKVLPDQNLFEPLFVLSPLLFSLGPVGPLGPVL